MCYPYGAYNDTLIDLLKNSGCALAFTTEVGYAQIKKENASQFKDLTQMISSCFK